MVKKAFIIILFLSFVWSCATYQPPPPSLYIGDLPESIVTELSLDERILTEEQQNELLNLRLEQAGQEMGIEEKLVQGRVFIFKRQRFALSDGTEVIVSTGKSK